MRRRLLFAIILSVILVCIVTLIIVFEQSKKSKTSRSLSLHQEGCLILDYHRIRPSNPIVKTFDKMTSLFITSNEIKYYSIYKDEFKQQIQDLKNHHVSFITPDQLLAKMKKKQPLPNKCVMLTFDDVDISVYKNAFPILKQEHIPFTLFIISGEVGDPHFKGLRLATWAQIKEMYHSGLATVGSHTNKMHYLDKTDNPPFLTLKNIKLFAQDTKDSILTIQKHLGIIPHYYAYPYGFGIPQTDKILQDSGFSLIFTLRPGIVHSTDPTFFIKRVLTTRQSWPAIKHWLNQVNNE